MSYVVDKNRGSGHSRRNELDLMTAENTSARSADSPQYRFYELEPAEVVDIILDKNHIDFNDFRDIGKAKIRMIHSNYGKDSNDLPYAFPVDPNIKSYPLKHEVVIVVEYLGNLYYSSKLNLLNNVNNNSAPFISVPIVSSDIPSNNSEKYFQVGTSGIPESENDDEDRELGDTFEQDNTVKLLRPFEGDLIIEGRTGNSIRFGTDNISGKPNIKIRVGQPENISDVFSDPYVVEDVNNDGNSFYLTTGEEIGLVPATIDIDNHLEFADGSSEKFDGNQIIMNSDRIVLNSKNKRITTFSKLSTNMVAGTQFTVDSGGRIITNSILDTTINSPKILLGSDSAKEPLVLGNKLVSWLQTLVQELQSLTVTTPGGTTPAPTTPPNPQHQAVFGQLLREINSFLSNQNFSV